MDGKKAGASSFIAVLLGLGAWAAHSSGLIFHEAALLGTKTVVDTRGVLDDIAKGTYIENQAVSLFCSASASLATGGSLPEEATDWREFVKSRVGITDDSQKYFDGKLDQLETAIDLARRNPSAAKRYAQACLLR